MMRNTLFLAIAVLGFVAVNAYIFECVGGCLCNTSDEIIHCHNVSSRQRLEMPPERLRGYTYIGMTNNDIRVLPSEDLLFEKFPDLKAIDIDGNRNFDCSTLDQYTRIHILSDCGKSPEEIGQRTVVDEPATPDCDTHCKLQHHYKALHAYAMKLWKTLKTKLEELNNTPFVTDVRKWVGETIANLRAKLEEKFPDEEDVPVTLAPVPIDAQVTVPPAEE
uniref:LRRNT domain-containing protein n=1 Tax=Panagrellus redivivus TaxID=6233 RepID=A0A7E4ULF9_PANRE